MCRRIICIISLAVVFLISCQRKSHIMLARETLQDFMKARIKNDSAKVNTFLYHKKYSVIEPEDPTLPDDVIPQITDWKVTGVQPTNEKNNEFLFTITVFEKYGGKYDISGHYDELIAIKKVENDNFKIIDIQTGNFYRSKSNNKK